MRDRWSMLHWLLLYALLSLLFAGALLWPGCSLYRWDTLLYTWPFMQEAKAQILAGRWPFWASSFCCGTPLIENINLGLLYPLRALIWFLPLRAGYQIFLFVHVVLTFWSMHILLQRGFRLRAFPAFVGAVAFGAAGYLRSMWDTHNFAVTPWIPLGFMLLLEAERPGGGRRATLGVGLAWACMILCGEFQAACLWWPLALLLALLRRARRSLMPALLGGSTLAVMITAPQWLPTVQASAESYRAAGLAYADAVERSFHPLRLLELLVPYAFGSRDGWWATALAGEGATKLSPWITSFHIGVLPLLLAAWSVRRHRRPAVRWALLLSVGGILLSFGRFLPGYRFWLELPVLGSFRYPEKYLLWPSLGLALLAAVGASRFSALLRRRGCRPDAGQGLARVALIVGLVLAAASAVLAYAAPWFSDEGAWWLAWRVLFTALLLFMAMLLFRERGAPQYLWVALIVLELWCAWRVEKPITTSFEPLQPPAMAVAVRARDEGQGRVLRDRAVQNVPLPVNLGNWRPSEKQAAFYRESLLFNSARMWGLRTAEGFSPSESAAMRAFRIGRGAPEDETKVPPVEGLMSFCRLAGVTWLYTTPERFDQLQAAGDPLEKVEAWGDPPALVLARRTSVREAEAASPGEGDAAVVHVWRARPGVIRVDLRPGSDPTLVRVSETFARGWRARDEHGARLAVERTDEAFIGVYVPGGITQIRLTYAPPGWNIGLLIGALGVLIAAGVWMAGQAGLRAWVQRPAFIVGAALLLALFIGLAARRSWACAFDEGYHVARGVAQIQLRDSRLAYFHPPLQNLLSGYFADLAMGERLRIPSGPSWDRADAHGFSVEFAYLNADCFGELVRSSRWGSFVFLALLIAVGALWATRLGGPMAGWLAGLGLALNPNLLAHGNLSTTDMGLTALAVTGSFALWHFLRDRRAGAMVLATAAFSAAALTKHTGLIWWAAFWLVAIPLVAAHVRSRRFLLWMLAAPAVLLLLLVLFYGAQPQALRLDPGSAGHGLRFPAAPYVEGLLRQTQHVLEGHRAFFAGAMHREGSWWHLPASLVLKSPAPWLLAAIPAAWRVLRRMRRPEWLIPLVPALAFSVLLLAGNKMTVGIRHALPYVALMTIAASVWAARIRKPGPRAAAVALLVLAAALSVALSFPHFLSYFPAWTGGVERGHRWLVDNNYDWGQEADVLEENWAALTAAGGGTPPNLVYFGFIDPSALYRIPVGPASLGGYMGWRNLMAQGGAAKDARFAVIREARGATVASVSALALDPFGLDLSALRNEAALGSPGLTFRMFLRE